VSGLTNRGSEGSKIAVKPRDIQTPDKSAACPAGGALAAGCGCAGAAGAQAITAANTSIDVIKRFRILRLPGWDSSLQSGRDFLASRLRAGLVSIRYANPIQRPAKTTLIQSSSDSAPATLAPTGVTGAVSHIATRR
jgi:hypothetical protein